MKNMIKVQKVHKERAKGMESLGDRLCASHWYLWLTLYFTVISPHMLIPRPVPVTHDEW